MNERTKRSFISPLAAKLSLVNVNSHIELFDFAQILWCEWLWNNFIGWNVLNSRIIVSLYLPVGVSTGRCIHRESIIHLVRLLQVDITSKGEDIGRPSKMNNIFVISNFAINLYRYSNLNQIQPFKNVGLKIFDNHLIQLIIGLFNFDFHYFLGELPSYFRC